MSVNIPAPALAPNQYPSVNDSLSEFLSGIPGISGDVYRTACSAIGSYVSCGVTVIAGLSYTTPEEIVNKILKERNSQDSKIIREAFVVFSDRDHSEIKPYPVTGGNALYKYIRDNNLGDIIEMGPRMNPNSGNMIKIWVWAPPHASLATKDKYMPVYGKILKKDQFGNATIYADDPRFKQNHPAATGLL